MNIILIGVLASLGAGLMTGGGAIPVLFGRTISRRATDTLLSFAAGVALGVLLLAHRSGDRRGS